MTSKEALENLTKSIKASNNGRLSLFEKLNVKHIEKDLDVLETLKPHLKLQNIGTTPKQEIVLVMDENMAGYKKLKEWLEK